MSVQRKEFIDSANQMIAEASASEMILRNACSRAYYSVYHAAEHRAGVLALPTAQKVEGGAHEQLFERYRSIKKSGSKLASLMVRYKRTRARCDYQLESEITREDALQHVKGCAMLFSEIERFGTPAVCASKVV